MFRTLEDRGNRFSVTTVVTLADALISSMESKLVYEYWRPVTAIRAGDTDGNRKTEPDPAWQTLIVTPPYPAYPSNYASIAYAAREVLVQAYGNKGHDITVRSAPGEGSTFEINCREHPVGPERCDETHECSIRPVWFALRRRIDALLSEIRLSDLIGEREADVRELIDITWGPVETAPAGEAPTTASA